MDVEITKSTPSEHNTPAPSKNKLLALHSISKAPWSTAVDRLRREPANGLAGVHIHPLQPGRICASNDHQNILLLRRRPYTLKLPLACVTELAWRRRQVVDNRGCRNKSK